MQRIIGRRLLEVDVGQFDRWLDGRPLTVDLGTGDGTAVVRAARAAPERAFLGVDADASRMRDASRRAARAPRSGGLPNAMFVVAAAETLPTELAGRVDQMRITLPWGSLLRGVLGAEPWLAGTLRDVLRPDGHLTMLLSVVPRDAVPGLATLDEPALSALVGGWHDAGYRVTDARAATSQDVEESGSSWARRLAIPARRPAALLRLVRSTADPDDRCPGDRR